MVLSVRSRREPRRVLDQRQDARPGRSTAARQHTLREYNLALVSAGALRRAQPRSRADIAGTTGLTRATVSVLVDQLIDARLVRELPPVTRCAPGARRALTPAGGTVVGLGLEVNVDYLGGTVLDLTGQVMAQEVVPGDLHDSDPAEVLGRLGALARRLVEDVESRGMLVAGARLALPGLVDSRAVRLQVAPNLGWSSFLPVPSWACPTASPSRSPTRPTSRGSHSSPSRSARRTAHPRHGPFRARRRRSPCRRRSCTSRARWGSAPRS
ncbi:hypothetical protein NKG05_06730 [Oerskovia sp. M15]